MRVFGVVFCFLFFVVPASLFAQGAGTGGGTTSGDIGITVESQATQGGFIGSGAPSLFVGVDTAFTSSTSSGSSARTTSRIATTRSTTARTSTARTASVAAQRSAMLAGGGSLSTQGIQSVGTFVSGDMFSMLTSRPTQATVETNLARIRGIQDGRITIVDSPTGGTTAVLTGVVASETERRIAKQLLLFEPGIYRVENLLEVQ